ncbi:MAG: hypothetical protein V3575_01130 [Candidatus Absconditabacteria bacterium]
MKNKILGEAYKEISNDNKLIRLATLTTIFHSLILVLYILFQTHFVITNLSHTNINIDLQMYWKLLFGHSGVTIIFIIIGLILIIGYFFLPPIAEGALIHYVASKNKSGTSSLGKGFMKFFPLFEFHGLISLFNFLVFFVAISRLYVIGILFNVFVLSIVIIRLLFIVGVGLLLPYAQFFIVIHNKGVYESIKESISMAVENFRLTFKFFLISYFLYLRFLINIILIIGLPLILMYIAIKLGLEDNATYLIYGVLGIMIIITAYINGIIEAFFISFWYKVFSYIEGNLEIKEDENAK